MFRISFTDHMGIYIFYIELLVSPFRKKVHAREYNTALVVVSEWKVCVCVCVLGGGGCLAYKRACVTSIVLYE